MNAGTHFDVDAVPEMDAKMTYAYLRYAADLLGWTHSARDENWLVAPKKDTRWRWRSTSCAIGPSGPRTASTRRCMPTSRRS